LGNIKITAHRVNKIKGSGKKEVPYDDDDPPLIRASGKKLKPLGITQSVVFGPPRDISHLSTSYAFDFLDGKESPIATFNMKYRSKESLKLILRPPKDLETKPIETLSSGEVQLLTSRLRVLSVPASSYMQSNKLTLGNRTGLKLSQRSSTIDAELERTSSRRRDPPEPVSPRSSTYSDAPEPIPKRKGDATSGIDDDRSGDEIKDEGSDTRAKKLEKKHALREGDSDIQNDDDKDSTTSDDSNTNDDKESAALSRRGRSGLNHLRRLETIMSEEDEAEDSATAHPSMHPRSRRVLTPPEPVLKRGRDDDDDDGASQSKRKRLISDVSRSV
ncbi:MAG: hypothetical protein Q9224_007224, partial [Gallowayella concinna]